MGGKIIICSKFKTTSKTIGDKSMPDILGNIFLIGLYKGSQISSTRLNSG